MGLFAATLPFWLGLSILLSRWHGGSALLSVSVSNSTQLLAAVQDPNVTDILLLNDIVLSGEEWNRVPTINITRNVTFRGVPTNINYTNSQGVTFPATIWPMLNCNHLVQRFHLAPGVTFTFQEVSVINHLATTGFYQAMFNASPNATVLFNHSLTARQVCGPWALALDNMRTLSRAAGAGGRQTVDLANSTICIGTTSTPVKCLNQYLTLPDVQGPLAVSSLGISTGGEGGYVLAYANHTYTCDYLVSEACVAASSLAYCITQKENELKATGVAATTVTPKGHHPPWRVAVIVVCALLGAATLTGIAVLLLHRRWQPKHSLKDPELGKSPGPSIELSLDSTGIDKDLQPSSPKSGNVDSSGALSDPAFRMQVQQLISKLSEKGEELQIQNAIGKGAYGTVYRGTWRNTEVAVKTVMFQGGGAESARRAVLEAAVSSALSHANIVATYHYDIVPMRTQGPMMGNRGTAITDNSSTDWKLYMVQEYCGEGDLSLALRSGKLRMPGSTLPSPVATFSILQDIAAGVGYIHSKSIIHGDLKPGNVLLKQQPHGLAQYLAKVSDFGLAVTMNPDRTHVSNYRAGSPFYTAPEVATDGRVTQASDVFAYGVMIWELCTGQRPYLAARDRTLSRHPDFGRFPPHTDPVYVQLLTKCLRRDPKLRPTFEQILGELQLVHSRLREAMLGAMAMAPMAPLPPHIKGAVGGGCALQYPEPAGPAAAIAATAFMAKGSTGQSLEKGVRTPTAESPWRETATRNLPVSLLPAAHVACQNAMQERENSDIMLLDLQSAAKLDLDPQLDSELSEVTGSYLGDQQYINLAIVGSESAEDSLQP